MTDRLKEYYDQNKTKPWSEWLEYVETFGKPGKQGLVGILRGKGEHKDVEYVFKISQYINYLAEHEETVMEGLNTLAPYCPHYCRSIGTITCKVDAARSKGGNPFDPQSKYPIEKEVLLCEYIKNSSKFYNYIRSPKVSEDVLYSTVKQTLLALALAQREKQFSHYDLHSFNMMMRKCSKDSVFLYVLDEENQFAVPTYGYYPIIIDFGFSYIQDLEDGPLYPSMGHTDVGFMSDRFDWVADPKLFLVSVSSEIKEKRKTKRARKLRTIVRNIFRHLSIDWEAGWDQTEEESASSAVGLVLEAHNTVSQVFADYEHYCLDLLQSLIIMPLERHSYKKIGKMYSTFLKEWVKIENQITDPFYNIYILKGIVDSARVVRADYTSSKTRSDAVKTFTRDVYTRINEVSKFCRPKDLHCEKLLCSMLMFSRNLEGLLFDLIDTRMAEKELEYDRMPLTSTEQIYGAIETNIPSGYVYSSETIVHVFDSLEKMTTKFEITQQQAETLNDLHPLCRGTALFDMLNKKKSPSSNKENGQSDQQQTAAN